MVLKSKRKVGKQLSTDSFPKAVANNVKNKKALIYFYTKTCRVCKQQKPIIEDLKNESLNIVEIDISENLPLAKELSIMGAPTTLLVKNNTIKDVLVGFKKYNILKDTYNSI